MVPLRRLVIVTVFSVLLFLQPGRSPAGRFCEGVVLRQESTLSVKPGELLEYRISVRHFGGCSLSGIELVDYLPQAARLVAASPQPDEALPAEPGSDGTARVSRLSWRRPGIKPDEALDLAVQVRAPEAGEGWMRNVVCLSGPELLRRCTDIETFVRSD